MTIPFHNVNVDQDDDQHMNIQHEGMQVDRA